MSAKFLLTLDDGPRKDPADAARLVRALGGSDLLHALPTPDPTTHSVYLPLNKVLLMIGTTDELVKACEKAHQRAQSLESADKKTIQMRWYVRVSMPVL